MEYHSALKEMSYQAMKKTWKHFQSVLLSERGQSEKAAYCMIPAIGHSGEGKTIETIKRSVISRNRDKHTGYIGFLEQ
jgi:hypothetical protein